MDPWLNPDRLPNDDRIGIPRLGRLDDASMSSNAPKRHLGKPVVMVKQRGDAFIYRLATLYIYMSLHQIRHRLCTPKKPDRN